MLPIGMEASGRQRYIYFCLLLYSSWSIGDLLNKKMNEFGTTQNLGIKDSVVCFKVTLDAKWRMYLRVDSG